MRRVFLMMVIFCAVAWLTGCEREKDPNGNPILAIDGSLDDGSIIIDGDVDVKINNSLNEMLVPTSTITTGSKLKTGVKSADDNAGGLKAIDYKFKLVAEMVTLKLKDGYEVQATDVKIDGDYAFVSYNDKGDAHRGGVVVYKYTVTEGTLETVKVDVEKITSMQMPNAELSAIEYHNNKLYMIGASSEPKFGYNENEDRFNYAFLLVMDLNASDKTFNTDATPKIVKLTSFQGTSVYVRNDRIFVTTGDGTHGTKGGLYIIKTTDYSLVKFVEKDHARSVVVDANNVYLMQAEPARISKYDLNGNNETEIYPPKYDLNSTDPDAVFQYTYQNESMQTEAKSEILFWSDYLFVSMNESGLRMLTKNEGSVNQAIERPGEDEERHVTNSVSMNTDKKKDAKGKEVQSNLLLLANGEKGVYWYDVVKDAFDNDRIVAGASNSILGEPGISANFISSKGNIVFVANGLGGLKVLYIGFPEEEDPDVCSGAFRHETFLKANGNAKDNPPLSKKVGEVLIQAEGDNLVVYLWPTIPNYRLNQSGVIFGSSLEYFNAIDGLFTGNPSAAPKDKNINNGFMTNRNSQYRTMYSDGSARFVFPRSEIEKLINENGELLLIVYSGNNAWGYGNPNGPSGQTGTGVNNNGQIIVLKDVTFCN